MDWYLVDRNFQSYLDKKYHNHIISGAKLNDQSIFNISTITDGDLALERYLQILNEKQFLDKQELVMYILLDADLQSKGTVLCKILMNTKKKVLKIFPKFNIRNQAYSIKHSTSTGMN